MKVVITEELTWIFTVDHVDDVLPISAERLKEHPKYRRNLKIRVFADQGYREVILPPASEVTA
jgi:hypothetical protein